MRFILTYGLGFVFFAFINSKIKATPLSITVSTEQMLDSAGYYYHKSQFDRSIFCGKEALKMAKSARDEKNIMLAHLTIGKSLFYQTAYTEAMKNYLICLKLAEKRKDLIIQTDCLNCIANIYYAQNDFEKAIEYYRKSLACDPEKGNSGSEAINFSYLAGVYYNLAQFDSAKIYYEKAIEINIKLKDSVNLILMQQNLAGVYDRTGKKKEALDLLNKALELTLAMRPTGDIGYAHFSIGMFYAQNNQHRKAIPAFESALSEFINSNDYAYMSNTKLALSECYYQVGDYKSSSENYRDHIAFTDSTQNQEISKELARNELRFQMEKKQLSDSLKNAALAKQEKLKNDERFKRQTIYIYAGAGGFFLMLLLALVLWRNNRHKQKANQLIKEQKTLVEEKQKEIIDSIKYARRIQRALLPSSKYISRKLDDLKK